MINLIPSDEKRQIRAARTNVILLRYLIIIAFAFAFLALITGASYYILDKVSLASQQQIASHGNVGHTSQTTAATQHQNFETLLTQAQSVLSTQIRDSTVLERLGSVLPSGVVLKSLTLTATSFGQPISLEFLATNDSAAKQLEKNLQSSPYFTSAIPGDSNNTGGDAAYPVSVTYTVTMNRTIAQ